jgi:hypothetical protein
MKQYITRRKFIKAMALAGVLPSITIGSVKAFASSPQLDPENAQAKALQYVHQSPIAEKICGNCRLYTGDAIKEWGPGAIFPGKDVANAGWCSAWVTKG